MRVRAKRKKDREMMTSGGGATEEAIKAPHVLPALSLGGDL